MELSAPEHVTADFIGEPGERTFYVQASERGELVSILVEKEQVASLADVLRRLLAEVDAEPPSAWDIASMRLREPIVSRWRGGEVAVGIDPQLGRFVIEVDEFVPDDDREPERVRIWLDEDRAAVLAAHAEWAVQQGRPPCRICGLPVDPDGHLCPRTNGDPRAR